MLVFAQLLNGLQYGVLLFLMAAGLTLVFGIMNFVNLAHGSLFMIGAYVAATVANRTGSFPLGLAAALGACLVVGLVLERVAVSRLYRRDHLDHVLATFGMIMFFNEMTAILWGKQPLFMSPPDALAGSVELMGLTYPSYRVAILAAGMAVAIGCYLLIHKTRLGMLIRAGANNAEMVGALGVNIKLLNGLLFALGACLAGMAGAMAGPIMSVQVGMGDPLLITTLVVIVIGGIGSVKGAFLSALLVGVVDTLGRVFLPYLLRLAVPGELADAAGPALASLSIFILMAGVLAMRPQGLFASKLG
jgi:branched-chain amino acid transport system permease protein